MFWKSSCLLSSAAVLLVALEASAAPASLKLKVDPNVLAPGRTASVRVGFADSGGQPCDNDQRRRVTLSLSSGAGQLDREFVDVEAGRGLSDEVTFTARASGDVIITARSQGLAPAQAVVVIRGSASTSLLGRLVPAVYADSGIGFTLVVQPLADGGQAGSWVGGRPAVVFATLGDLSDAARRPTLEVWTESEGWSIAIDGAPAGGGRRRATLTEHGAFITVQGRPSAREVCVFARIAENGDQVAPQRECLHFTGAVPSGIAFDPPDPRVHASDAELALTLRMVDQYNQYIDEPIKQKHEIEIISSHPGARLESGTPCPSGASTGPCLTLLPGTTRGRANLKWSGLSAGTTLKLTARDRDDTAHLNDGEARIVIAASPLALALLAAAAGIVGGLARLFYLGVTMEGRQWYRLDRRGATHLGFSGIFGLTLFQAADVGIASVPILASATGWGLTFVLGTLGGYGGVLVLDRLLAQVLPGAKAS